MKSALIISGVMVVGLLSFASIMGISRSSSSAERFAVNVQTFRLKGGNVRLSCGPIALHEVFRANHIPSSLSEITRQVAPSARGAPMSSLISVARSYGLRATGWQLTFGDLSQGRFPVIAFVNGNHYVVVDTVISGSIIVMHDVWGERRYTREQFVRIWRGESIVFGE